jgi:hypothetical protein
MVVKIHGPNLLDQSKGQFRVHTSDCRDNDRVAGSDYPWSIDVSSKYDVVVAVYGDILDEDSDSYESCRDDIYFEPCCSDLPEED